MYCEYKLSISTGKQVIEYDEWKVQRTDGKTAFPGPFTPPSVEMGKITLRACHLTTAPLPLTPPIHNASKHPMGKWILSTPNGACCHVCVSGEILLYQPPHGWILGKQETHFFSLLEILPSQCSLSSPNKRAVIRINRVDMTTVTLIA